MTTTLLRDKKVHSQTRVEVPCVLEREVRILQAEHTDYLTNKKYKKFRSFYIDWQAEELLSRLRILCVEARAHAFEICAVYDELLSKC